MDGHFTDSTWWRETKEMEFSTMLEAIGGQQSCCLEVEKGKSWQDYVLSSLPPKVQKKGASHKKYKQEEPLFSALVMKRFDKEFNYALTDAKKEIMVKKEYAQHIDEDSNKQI